MSPWSPSQAISNFDTYGVVVMWSAHWSRFWAKVVRKCALSFLVIQCSKLLMASSTRRPKIRLISFSLWRSRLRDRERERERERERRGSNRSSAAAAPDLTPICARKKGLQTSSPLPSLSGRVRRWNATHSASSSPSPLKKISEIA